MKLIFLDLETTGLNPKEDEVIQLAYSLNQEEKIHSHLYQPHKSIPYEVSGLTNIDRRDVEGKPNFEESVEIKDLELKVKENYIAVTHNTDFDLAFLKKYGIHFDRSLCTLMVSKKLVAKEVNNHKLGTLRAYYGIKKPNSLNPHDAAYDVEVLREIYKKMRSSFESIEKMMEYEKESRLDQLKTWSFGKFSGEIISKEKHGDYIEWFLDQPPNPKYPHDPNFIQHLKNVLSEKEPTQANDGKLF